MFRSWSKKNKIKAVFRLQFQATEVPKLKKSVLMISLVPEDVGKPTVKLEKAAIEDGTCFWENPVYETVRLVRDKKTGKIHEKIYHFVVSTGSSKSGFLGEASIDFADFEAETEPMTVSLPLKFANSGAILHVTIQKMEGDNDQRNGEENGALALQHDRSFNSQLSFSDTNGNHNFCENTELNNGLYENAKQNGSFVASNGSNGARFAPGWDTNYEENTQYVQDHISTLRQNSIPKKEMIETATTKSHAHRISNTDWSLGSFSDGSFADSLNSPEDNLSRERLQEVPDDSVEKLKLLMRQVEVSEVELQSLRKQVVKETKQGQNLSRQIISITEERDALKIECKQLKHLKKCRDEADESKTLHTEIKDLRVQLEAMRQEVEHEKELRTDLQLQLLTTQESNADLILAVRDLEEMIELKNRVIADLSRSLETWKNDEVQENRKMNIDETQQSEVVEDRADIKEIELLKLKITDLTGEIDIYIKQRDELEIHTRQLTADNELLKQENHNISTKLEQSMIENMINQNECSRALEVIKELEAQVERLEHKMKKQAEDFSESLVSNNELESQVKGLEKELEMQALSFEEDLNAMKCAKIEQEQRAFRAEESLRKTRWKNASTIERLQEEFKKLSVEMASKFDDNEKVTMKAVTEANEVSLQKRAVEEMLEKSNEKLRLNQHQSEVKLQELSDQLNLKSKRIEQMSTELDDKSNRLEDMEKHEEKWEKEIQMLESKIEGLTVEKHNCAAVGEKEQLRTLTSETEMLVKRWNSERDNLEKRVASAKEEAEKAREELSSMKSLKDQKDTVIANLLSEVADHRIKYNDLKQESYKIDLEKENLRKQVLQLRDEIQKKEDITTSIGKNPQHENLKRNTKLEKCSDKEMGSSNSHTSSKSNLNDLLTEVSLLKEKNKSMERELKEMEERYSEISLKFAEVEGERQQLVMAVRNLKNGKKN